MITTIGKTKVIIIDYGDEHEIMLKIIDEKKKQIIQIGNDLAQIDITFQVQENGQT